MQNCYSWSCVYIFPAVAWVQHTWGNVLLHCTPSTPPLHNLIQLGKAMQPGGYYTSRKGDQSHHIRMPQQVILYIKTIVSDCILFSDPFLTFTCHWRQYTYVRGNGYFVVNMHSNSSLLPDSICNQLVTNLLSPCTIGFTSIQLLDTNTWYVRSP